MPSNPHFLDKLLEHLVLFLGPLIPLEVFVVGLVLLQALECTSVGLNERTLTQIGTGISTEGCSATALVQNYRGLNSAPSIIFIMSAKRLPERYLGTAALHAEHI